MMGLENETSRNSVVDSLIDELIRGREIVSVLDDDAYARMQDGESSIGAHIRHNLEFVNELLNGIDERRVDYNARQRELRVEVERVYSIEQLSFACDRLRSLTTGMLASLVMVRSEVDFDLWHTSSVAREIEFLHSHTVHHYALVARRMSDLGLQTDSTLGIAPSTLRYRAAIASY